MSGYRWISTQEKVVVCVVLAVTLGAIGGWIANIVKLVSSADPITGMVVARAIGVFVAPLGAVLGFF